MPAAAPGAVEGGCGTGGRCLLSPSTQVVDIMRVNVDKVLERDQKLSELDDRADALQAGASVFESSAAKLKRKYWWKNCKMMIMMGVICAIVVVVIVNTIQDLTAFYCLVAFWKMLGLMAEKRMRVVLSSVTMLNGKDLNEDLPKQDDTARIGAWLELRRDNMVQASSRELSLPSIAISEETLNIFQAPIASD
ncbi:hypothetical protein CIB84_001593 [Bambusicola thoracicus]|uniref:V-SNARE coiled-coil homology domain-containing protein n=1 Tax=Bambusicola thoracicus TaxID=9083 RepID=A0A2P4TE85_BAMTH|nr:hypothetical protein CIB84_001593 [Bambusicola thoracicus]